MFSNLSSQVCKTLPKLSYPQAPPVYAVSESHSGHDGERLFVGVR